MTQKWLTINLVILAVGPSRNPCQAILPDSPALYYTIVLNNRITPHDDKKTKDQPTKRQVCQTRGYQESQEQCRRD